MNSLKLLWFFVTISWARTPDRGPYTLTPKAWRKLNERDRQRLN